MRRGIAALLAVVSTVVVSTAVVSTVAEAGEAPRLVPSRDVAITYRSERGDHVLVQQVRWSAAEQRMRIDSPSPGLYVLIDYPAHRMAIVRSAERSVIDMPTPSRAPWVGAGLAGAGYARAGADRVAGMPCAEWQGPRPAGESAPTTICVTEDGILLRVRQAQRVLAEADSVTYGPQEAALFRVPDGFTHAQRP